MSYTEEDSVSSISYVCGLKQAKSCCRLDLALTN